MAATINYQYDNLVTGDTRIDQTKQTVVVDHCAYSNPALSKSYGPLTMEGTQNAGGGMSAAGTSVMAANVLGGIAINTGTTSNSTGQGFLYTDTNLTYAGSMSRIIWRYLIQLPLLSDSTNEYVAEIGLRNQFTGALSNNAIAFMYKRSTSTNWQAYTSNNGTSTIVTTADTSLAVTAAAKWTLVIDINPTFVNFYAGAGDTNALTLLGSSSTNLPNSSNTCFPMHTIYRAATFALKRELQILRQERRTFT
jgi:hypothetical protein